jgi:hypothetical protein
LSNCCDGECFKRIIYFRKYIYLFVTRSKITEIRKVFLADEGDVSGAQADDKEVRRLQPSKKARHIICSFHPSLFDNHLLKSTNSEAFIFSFLQSLSQNLVPVHFYHKFELFHALNIV